QTPADGTARAVAYPACGGGTRSRPAAGDRLRSQRAAAALARTPDHRSPCAIYVPLEAPPTTPPLSIEQYATVALLNAGQTLNATVRLLHLPRQTVQSWVYRSPQMQAALTRADLLGRIAKPQERALHQVLAACSTLK